jgi:hypothetical protein
LPCLITCSPMLCAWCLPLQVGITNSLPRHILEPHADLVVSHLDEIQLQ